MAGFRPDGIQHTRVKEIPPIIPGASGHNICMEKHT